MLKDDIKAGESDRLEFKEQLPDNAEKWLKTVVAFANCRGGRILFGVSNFRKVKGLDCDVFAARDAIVDAIANACEPTIPMSIGVSSIDGKPIIVLEVAEGRKTPYFLKAKGQVEGVYVRYDATTRQADDLSLKDLIVNGSGRSFDQLECRGLEVTDDDIAGLCGRMFEVARANARNDEQRELVKPVTKAQLLKWRILIPDGKAVRATNAYALLAGSDLLPVETKCAVFKGMTRDMFVDRRNFGGPLYNQVESAFEYVLSKINIGAKIEGLYREDVFEIPPSAIRELVVNAIVHRNYVNGESSAVSIALYDDRLEVTSPGRLPYGVTIGKMLDGYSECRNKALAQAFAYMNLIEDWGSGIPRIMKRVRAAGLRDIEFQAWPTAFRATVYRLSRMPDGDIGAGKRDIGAGKRDIGAGKRDIGAGKRDIGELTGTTLSNIAVLRRQFGTETPFRRADAAKALSLHPSSLSRLFGKMVKLGIVIPVSGLGKGAYRFPKSNHE